MLKTLISKYGSELKMILFGVLWIVVAILFWWYLAGNPIDELKLILNSEVTDGFIVDAWEDIEDRDTGTEWVHSYLYEFQIPDGRKYQGTEEGNGRIILDIEQPYPIEVEYLPDNPKVSRIKGSGSSDVWEWLLRKIGVGGLLLIMFSFPGFILIRNGINDIQEKDEILLLKEYLEEKKE